MTRETVKDALFDFAAAYGWPQHIEKSEQITKIVDLYNRELSRTYTDADFSKGVAIAWDQCRKFPVVSDFHRGWDAPARKSF